MKEPREMCYPQLYQQPTLLQVLAMKTGNLAKWTFGKPTDPVFRVYRVETHEGAPPKGEA